MPHGQPHTGTDPILETLKRLEEEFATPETGRRAERFARGQERQTADLARLFEQSQQPSRRTLGDKLTPILEAIAFTIDRTSGDRRRRGEALPKFQAIRGAREERAGRKRQERRQQFADQANILGLIGEGKRAAFTTRRGARQEERRQREKLLGVATDIESARAKAAAGPKLSASDLAKIKANERYDELFATSVIYRPDGTPDWEATPFQVKKDLNNAAKIAGLDPPVPDLDVAATDDRAEARKQAVEAIAATEQIFDTTEAYLDAVDALTDQIQGLGDPGVESGDINPADFLPAVEPEEPGLSLSDIFPDIGKLRPEARAQNEALIEAVVDLVTRQKPLPRIAPPVRGRTPGALPFIPALQQ